MFINSYDANIIQTIVVGQFLKSYMNGWHFTIYERYTIRSGHKYLDKDPILEVYGPNIKSLLALLENLNVLQS